MARGNLYIIGTAPFEDGCSVCADDFNDYADFEFNFVVKPAGERVEEEIKSLLQFLQGLGATVSDGTCKDPWFVLTDDVKKAYFRGQFDALKKLVAEMSLEDFAVGEGTSNKILQNTEDRYHDAVSVYNSFDEFVTVDSFIRTAATGAKYYIGSVLWMN